MTDSIYKAVARKLADAATHIRMDRYAHNEEIAAVERVLAEEFGPLVEAAEVHVCNDECCSMRAALAKLREGRKA